MGPNYSMRPRRVYQQDLALNGVLPSGQFVSTLRSRLLKKASTRKSSLTLISALGSKSMRYNPCFVMAVLVTILGQVAGAEAQTPRGEEITGDRRD